MIRLTLEVAAFAAIATGVFLVAGLGFALITAGAMVLIASYLTGEV